MPSKTEEYLALAQRTANGLTRYWESWTDYLTTASRLYKYSFADQLMIYAQRPDATACADFDIWNNRMNRYVRRGAKGIALLDESSGFPRLHYVFDVSDTGVRRNSRDPEVWQLGPDLVQPVSEMLSKTYGISGERVSQQLADVAGKLVADYWDNNGGDIRAIVDGSLLMDYDEAGVEMQFKSAAAISVTYTLLERCGIEPAGWFDKDDFQAIYNFSTPDSVYALGAAVSDMSREVLRNIERTVKTTIRRRNNERSQHEYEQQSELHADRGLSSPEPDPPSAEDPAGQVRQAAPDVSDESSPGAVQHDAPVGEPVPAPDGGGADGREPDAADDDRTAGEEPGPGQGAESDGMGAAHEQPESTGRGTGAERTDLQLSFFDAHIPTEAKQIESIDQAESEKSPSAFVLSQAEIENALRRGSNVEGSKLRIWKIYQLQPDRKLRAKALANEYAPYGPGGSSHTYLDGSSGWLDHDSKGLTFEHYPDHQKVLLRWDRVEKYIDLMIQSDRYLSDKERRAIDFPLELNAASAAEYTALKAQHSDTLVGFEAGGNFMFYGEDAAKVAKVLNSALFTRETALGEVQVTGFPPSLWIRKSKELWSAGNDVYLAGLNEDGTHHQTKHLHKEDYLPIGSIINMDGRKFRIDGVDFDKGKVSLQDMALADLRMPVFREEPLSVVRELYEQQDEALDAAPEKAVDYKVGDNVVVELPTRTIEGKIGYVGETDVRIDTSAQGYSWSNEVLNKQQFEDSLRRDEPTSDESLDKLPISGEVNGEWQTFPDAAALDEALNTEPAPEPAGNFHITDDDLGIGGPKQKYARNIEAIRTLFQLEQEHRGATAEEQQVLSQYVGWGGLADAFNPGKDSWAKEYAELKGLRSDERKDDVITFEQLGVDRLFVDESHFYKNLFLTTKMRNVAGLSTSEAQKSSDMFGKCRYLDEITGGRGVVFATGTPVSNSMTELYTVMRYLQYSTLQQKKLTHFDCWASTFGETTTAIELAPEGTGYRARTRFAKFFNLPELMSMFKEVADIKTSDQLHLPVPVAKFETVVAKPSEIQKEMVQELSKRAADIHSGIVDASVDNMLCVTNDGRKIGLDVRLMNPMLPDDPNSKLNVCVQNVLKIWEEGKDQKLTQLLFCDLSTPKNDGNFNVYDDIRKKLVAAGVPENEIEFIHNADTEAKKAALFSKVRSGDVRVLLGSTAKMGAGTNVQSRLVAVHHLDVGWKPSDMTQRNGRIIRQGNMNKEVKVFNYVTEGTFDSYLFQTLENKQRFISQIMTSKSPVRSCEDVDEQALSYAEIKALCAGNPLIKEKMDLDVQVAKLKVLKADHQSQKFRLQDKLLTKFPADIQETNAHIAGLKADAQLAAAHPQGKEEFCGMTIKGVTYDEKKTAGERLVLACSELPNAEEKVIGSYRGFELSLRFDTFRSEYQALLKGQRKYTVPLGTDPLGNIIRLDNSLNSFPERITSAENELTTLHQQQAAAQIEVEKPFPQEEELAEKSARLAELNAQLDVDEKSHEPEQDEEEQEDAPRRPSVLAALEEKSDKPEPVKPFRSYYDKDGDAR